jgi:hypothetical protein
MSTCTLVGRFSYKSLCSQTLDNWISTTWMPLLGYSPEVLYLKRGWFGFHCRTPEDATLLLSSYWVIDGSSLMLKRWRLAFSPEKDYFLLRHLWVLLPGLPLHFWNEEALRAIGDSLGKFITLDSKSLSSQSRIMGKVMVEIDTSSGLPESLEILWRGRRHLQPLDYLGIPFRCNLCRATGHLRRSCPGIAPPDSSEEEDLLLNPPDYMDPDPALAHLEVPPSFLSSLESDQAFSPLKKVSQICPSLFSSLSEAEKNTVLNFPWLSSRTSVSPPAQDVSSPPSPAELDPSPSTLTAQPLSHSSDEGPETHPLTNPGFGQSDEVDPNLLDELASSRPLSHLPFLEPQLAIFRGKELIRPGDEAGSSCSLGPEKSEKAYAWSRGIGTELSPLQTRSSRKQKQLMNPGKSASELPSLEGKALRALKALARSK